ncbi:MAG TPA: threonine synthase [Clostridia bacterium]|nr:threonine synthase [Clostridia bacterium]
MMYISTRDNFREVTASTAIRLGMVPKGGLFVPARIPVLPDAWVTLFPRLSYQEKAVYLLTLYLEDYLPEEIKECVDQAYNGANFQHQDITPLEKLEDDLYVLELWHGPTAAFKDLALQIMPHLLSLAVKKGGQDRETVILVATSGDTGKAALEGFKDVPGIQIIVFYPGQGVSKVQELQMTTTTGRNTHVVAVQGNFDDCQNAVKEIFADEAFNSKLKKAGYDLSSANSINWGRLVPQIVYYFAAYGDLVTRGEIKAGSRVNIVVPTGNFGNILAGWYGARMGLPVHRFICASNENKVLTDFFQTGIYNRNRPFKRTSSPSMDILISSNLERFLFEITSHDAEKIRYWMENLSLQGGFTVDKATRSSMDGIMEAGYATEEETLTTIGETFRATGYTLDPHTAVGKKVYQDYRDRTGDQTPTILAATASPFKFNASVMRALKGDAAVEGYTEFEILGELARVAGLSVHPGLAGLECRLVLHGGACASTGLRAQIEEILLHSK